MFLGKIMQMLAIHSRLTRCRTKISVLAFKKPSHVATFELRFQRRSRLTITLRGIELRGN